MIFFYFEKKRTCNNFLLEASICYIFYSFLQNEILFREMCRYNVYGLFGLEERMLCFKILCSYSTWLKGVFRGIVGSHAANTESNGDIDDNRVEDIEPNRDPLVEDSSTLKSLRVQKGV